jgi:hypothetical protein
MPLAFEVRVPALALFAGISGVLKDGGGCQLMVKDVRCVALRWMIMI